MAHKIQESCIACGACVSECPLDAIKEGTPYTIDDSCGDCGVCVSACPVGAIVPA
ncbi:MAG: 4Fe-4S binding protein [Chitinispirillales bacterium]|jgi:NAD-dependent dihydropyrimidine dehydrogenase PreA subunit|nr:4Fe-4S binding protein [Chitinispirillales bacterium]